MIGQNIKRVVVDLHEKNRITVQALSDAVSALDSVSDFMRVRAPQVESHMINKNNPHLVRGSQILAEPNGDYVLGGSGYHFYYDATNDAITLRLASQTMAQLTTSTVEINPYGYDADFQLDGITSTYLFGDATNQRIGIGTIAPDSVLHVAGTGHFTGIVSFNDNLVIDNTYSITWKDSVGTTTNVVTLDSNDRIVFGSSQDYDMRFQAKGNQNAIYIDSGNGWVGMGTASPNAALHIQRAAEDPDTNPANLVNMLQTYRPTGASSKYKTAVNMSSYIDSLGTGSLGGIIGGQFKVNTFSTSTNITTMAGGVFVAVSGNNVTSTIANLIGGQFQIDVEDAAVTTAAGIQITAPQVDTGSATILKSIDVATPSLGAGASVNNYYGIQLGNIRGTTVSGLKYSIINTGGDMYFSDTVICNGSGDDYDFQVKGLTDDYLIYGNAGLDFVGIGTNTPDGKLHIFSASAGSVTAHANADDLIVENSGNAGISIIAPSTSYSSLFFGDEADNDVGGILYYHVNDDLYIVVNAGTAAYFTSDFTFYPSGNVVIPNHKAMYWKDLGGSARRLVVLDNSDNFVVGPYDTGWGSGKDTYISSPRNIVFRNNGSSGSFTAAATINPTLVRINQSNNDIDFQVSGVSENNILYVDAGNDRVGFFTSAPGCDVHIYNGSATSRPLFRLDHQHDSQYGGYLQFLHRRVINSYPSANDVIGTIQYRAFDTTPSQMAVAGQDVQVISVGSGYVETKFRWTTMDTGGSLANRMTLTLGLELGSPTGGDKGTGTINVAGDIYKNNTAYTNPDYVLEHWVTGKIEKFSQNLGASNYIPLGIGDIERFIKENLRLPGVTDDTKGLFQRSDIALELIERLYCFTIEQEKRLKLLEEKIKCL